MNSPNHCPGLVTTEAPSSIEHRLLVTQLMEMVRNRKKGGRGARGFIAFVAQTFKEGL
jgi:hypothetical protein